MDYSPPGFSVPGILQADTGVGRHALLQGIFPTQGLNLHLLTSSALAGGFFTARATWEAASICLPLGYSLSFQLLIVLSNFIIPP